jgi:hypothetical protein
VINSDVLAVIAGNPDAFLYLGGGGAALLAAVFLLGRLSAGTSRRMAEQRDLATSAARFQRRRADGLQDQVTALKEQVDATAMAFLTRHAGRRTPPAVAHCEDPTRVDPHPKGVPDLDGLEAHIADLTKTIRRPQEATTDV